MFEYKIQQAWESYKLDFGLGRILLFLAFYNVFLFFLSAIAFGEAQSRALYPVALAFLFYFLRPQIVKLPKPVLFGLNTIPITISVLLNYYLIGEIDRTAGGLTRRDPLFVAFDNWLFGKPVALYFQEAAELLGTTGSLFYDLMMVAYISYFLLPFYGGILFYRMLSKEEKYKVGRFFFSVVLYFALNFIFYLLVPVTGPQFWMEDVFTDPLPLTSFGLFFWNLVHEGQTTFIDCFPSGHTGIAFLVSIWMYRLNHSHRHILGFTTLLIIMATLAMRYHYTMDLFAAFGLAYFCHRAAWIFIPVHVKPSSLRRENPT